MAAVTDLPLSGPGARGRGVHGQYVYAMIMPQPTPEVVARGMKQPSDFDRASFGEMVVQCLAECGMHVIEAACFREPHANGSFHLNLLVRAGQQYNPAVLYHFMTTSTPTIGES